MSSFTYSLKKARQHPLTAIFIKSGIFLFTLFYIYHSLHQNGHTIGQIISTIHDKFTSGQFIYSILPVVLIPVNWGLEAKKWQLLARKVETLSFLHAFTGILAGLTLGFITPHTLGDYAGRIWQLNSQNRCNAIASIWLGRLSQLYITLFAGSAALIYFLSFTSSRQVVAAVLLITGSIHIIFLLLFFFREWWMNKLNGILVLQFLLTYIEVIKTYAAREIIALLTYAALRYAVFSLQFYFILLLFGISLHPGIMFTGIALVFLSKSVVPTFSFLADLGIRETAALYFFGAYGIGAAQIVAASLSLWLLNILIPALFGSVFMLRLKITS